MNLPFDPAKVAADAVAKAAEDARVTAERPPIIPITGADLLRMEIEPRKMRLR